MKTTALLLTLLGVAACKKASSEGPTPTASPKPVEVVADEPAAPPEEDTYAAAVADADELLAAWLDAQNRGDFDAYLATYSMDFIGTRRTAEGAEKTFKLDGWKADRKKMFAGKLQVAIDHKTFVVEEDGTVKYHFIQRFRVGKYADHGEKVIIVDGNREITVEDMRWSVGGWDDNANDPIDATAMKPPITIRLTSTTDRVNGECQNGLLTLQIKDAAGATARREIGSTTGIDDGVPAGLVSSIKPRKKGKAMFTAEGGICGGLVADYSVARVDDTIVVTETLDDDEVDASMAYDGVTRTTAVLLPAGAEIVTR